MQPDPHSNRHHPRKRFGQHFLDDSQIIQRIVHAIAPSPAERIVEIGPGQGALTFPLLRSAGALTAIELDRDLVEPLRNRARDFGKIEVICADALNVDFTELAGGDAIRLVGNLPYNISTPILFHCLQHAPVIKDMHFMLQKEVVDRMAAAPGSKVYGRLSVMLQLRCQVEPLFDVPPSAFRPPPKVDSSMVRLTPLQGHTLPEVDFHMLEHLVRAAFGQRRKTLSNALRGQASATQISAAGLNPKLRAEQLAPHDYVTLTRHLTVST